MLYEVSDPRLLIIHEMPNGEAVQGGGHRQVLVLVLQEVLQYFEDDEDDEDEV